MRAPGTRIGTVVRLGVRDLLERRGVVVGLGLLIALPLFASLLLGGFSRAIETIERRVEPLLVVQEANSVGEIAGSRLSPDVADRLRDAGVSDLVPEIHSVVGESVDEAILLRGVDVDRYTDVTDFERVSGRRLRPGDPPRTAMIGQRLAERRDLAPGDTLEVRARTFEVVGVFRVGTFADNEAWIPLGAAQEALGWGEDVSLFVIPDEGVFEAGDALPGAIAVSRRGDVAILANEWLPLLRLLDLASTTLEIGGVVILAFVLWRIAWLRRRELGILRLVGFSRRAQGAYLLVQGLVITLGSVAVGTAAALLAAQVTATEVLGTPIAARIDPAVLVRTLGTTAAVLAVGIGAPVLVLQRRRVTDLLRRH